MVFWHHPDHNAEPLLVFWHQQGFTVVAEDLSRCAVGG
jgi:hypothetical protein